MTTPNHLPRNYDLIRELAEGKRYVRDHLTGNVFQAPVPYKCAYCVEDATYHHARLAAWMCVHHWVAMQ
jgi:hypothetical protein